MPVPDSPRCARCKWENAAPGEPVCWTCAISIARRHCPHAGEPELVIQRAANGYRHPKLRCRTCYKVLASPKLRDIDESAAVAETRSPAEAAPCQRCGSTEGAEKHHWAPIHLFTDADDWPTAMLCPPCHTRWHVATGTAGTAQPADRPEV